jgi:hypothetical protein
MTAHDSHRATTPPEDTGKGAAGAHGTVPPPRPAVPQNEQDDRGSNIGDASVGERGRIGGEHQREQE